MQGNVPGEGMEAFAERRAVLHNHAEATRDFAADVAAGVQPAPDIMIWPENSTDIDPFRDQAAYDEIDSAVKAIGVPVLVGAVVYGPGDEPGPEHGYRLGPRDRTRGGIRQTAHRAVRRVHPDALDDRQGLQTARSDPPGLRTAEQRTVSSTSVASRIGDVICFEVAYDGLVRNVISDGGQVLVVQTNNATYAGTGQLEQQFAISRYRAIETGRSVVIAATNGISGVVDADGSVVVETEQKTRAVINEDVQLADGRTLGVRFGGWVEILMAIAGLGLAVARLFGAAKVV